MKNFFSRFFAWIGFLTLLSIGLMLATSLWISNPSVPSSVILEINLERKFVENLPDDPITELMTQDIAFVRDTVDAIYRASSDDRVMGIVARVGNSNMGLAKIQEIRDAILEFRSKGKPTVAWAESFGEFSSGTGAYYLATAFDKIYLYPSGDVGLTGLTIQTPFIRGMFEKLKITPRLDHRQEYKNAMNLFTETQYTEPHREALQAIMNSQFNQIVDDVAKARKLTRDQVLNIFDQGPLIAPEALKSGLVDGLKYRDEVYQITKDQFSHSTNLLYSGKYLKRAGRLHEDGETIALIYGVGTIQRGESNYDLVFGGTTMGSDSVAKAFRTAIDDPDVKAIIFRVDSPGGSAVASDAIWRETIRAKEAGKPVIVSMSDVAGSGGYWVSMNADKIIAQPASITGSIGVLAGKLYTEQFWQRFGITYDKLQSSKNGTMWSNVYDYSPGEWQRLQTILDRIYSDFTEKVAAGRNMPIDKVRELAKGRIWTGEDAKKIGLVDELGGFPVAIRLAKEAAKIDPEEEVQISKFPKKSASWKKLLRIEANSSEDTTSQVAFALSNITKQLKPILDQLNALGIDTNTGVVQMPAHIQPTQ